MKDIFKLVGEVILMVVGVPIFIILFVVGAVYTFVKHIFKKDYSTIRQFTPIIRSITLVFDGLANAGAGEMLNDLLKIENKHARYGKWYETISAVTGLVRRHEKDTWLRKFLEVLDKDHCEDAITENLDFYYNHKFKT